jgi:hypothetical protein
MKLVRFGPRGAEKPGLVGPGGKIKDCAAQVADYDHEFFAGGGLARLRPLAADAAALPDAPAGVRLGPPVARPRNVFAIGLNYSDHARETGAAIPAEPVLFMKATSTVCGPHDAIIIPRGPRLAGRGPRAHRRLLRGQRRLGAGLSEGAGRAVEQGEVVP